MRAFHFPTKISIAVRVRLRLSLCIFLMTAIITVMFGFGRNALVLIWPTIIEKFSIRYFDVGALTAFHQTMYLLSSIAAGTLVTSNRPEIAISFATIFGGVLMLSIRYIESYSLFFIVYGILGILIAYAWVPMVRYTALNMTKTVRIAALSIAACGTAVGFLVNSLFIPKAIEKFGFSNLWLGLGLVTIFIGASSYVVMRPLKMNSQRLVRPEWTKSVVQAEFPISIFLMISFLCGLGLVSFQTYYSAYLVEDLNYTKVAAGQAWLFPGFAGVLSGVFLTAIAYCFSVRKTIFLSLIILAIAILLMGLLNSPMSALLVSVLYGLFYFGLFGLFPALLANTVDQDTAGRVFGYANLFLGIGSATGSLAGGMIMYYFKGFELFWVISAAGAFVAAGLILRLPSDYVKTSN